MADNTIINAPSTPGQTIATKDIGGVNHELVILEFSDGAGGAAVVSEATPLPVEVLSLPAGLATSANQQTDALTDTELRANPVPISGTVTVDTSLLSTSAKQTEQTALLTTLNSLIETNNYLVQFLSQLTGAMNSGQPALRTIPIASVSTAVTGSLTSAGTVSTVGTITNFGTGIPASEMAHDINNFTAILANINNVTP